MLGHVDDREHWDSLLAGAAAERANQPRRIAELCVEMLGVTGAGIGLVTDAGNRGVVCATDDTSSQIEDLQLTLGEGPCIDAAASGRPVLVPDLTDPVDLAVDRWPAFLEGATTAGVRAVFAFPLRIGAIKVGVMDLYRDQAGDLSDAHLAAALVAADAAAVALLHLDTGRDDAFDDDPAQRGTYQLQVHQATGMVQVQAGVTTEQAFLMLRARAFSSGRPLEEVATDVVERRLRFTPED